MMTEKRVVFFPNTLLDSSLNYHPLMGFIRSVDNVSYYFIFNEFSTDGFSVDTEVQTLGHFLRNQCNFCIKHKECLQQQINLCITEVDGKISINLSSSGKTEDVFVLIVYDPLKFCNYEVLLENRKNTSSYVCFIMLSKRLASIKNLKKSRTFELYQLNLFINFTPYLLIILKKFISFFNNKIVQTTLLRLTLLQYILAVVKNQVWLIEENLIQNNKTSKTKAINYLLSCLFDAILGTMCLHMLVAMFTSSEKLFYFLSNISYYIIKALQGTLQWLMGSPAGLKLNDPLNSLLGTCFLYLVNIWWSFLVICRPLLEIVYNLYMFIGKFGLSFQIAILEDVLALVTFHVYCIYVYAAWLYNLQWKSLTILAKLFVGRSCNPQPGRTTPYTTQQLYVGTISFAILLFLLPTTLIYYVVFVVMRILLVMIRGLLIRSRYTLQVLPVYTTLIWFLKPSLTAGIVKLEILDKSKSNTVVLNATLVNDSWWATIKNYIPESVEKPLTVSWIFLIERVCSGKLLYPI